MPWFLGSEDGARIFQDVRGGDAIVARVFGVDQTQGHANARLIAAAPDMRQASQSLYNATNRFLMGVESCDMPADLEQAMDEMEAAWHKADGTKPEAA